jgi:hypothetical protein
VFLFLPVVRGGDIFSMFFEYFFVGEVYFFLQRGGYEFLFKA